MAVLCLWILACALAIVAALALYALRAGRSQQVRSDALGRERQARDVALEHLISETLPAIARLAGTPEAAAVPINVPAGLERSRYAQRLQEIAELFSSSLRQTRADAHNTTLAEADSRARKVVQVAEDTVRAELDNVSRGATSAAVRSFGTSVVSLGADVSHVVSTALREHRDDAVYETLTRIDHSVQQMIRQAQSYVIVCGGVPGRRWPAQSLTDVTGGAAGRVRDYLRVRAHQLDRMVVSRAVEPLVHTMATLLDNALRYSPPTAFVDVSFQEGHHGATVIIDDAGVRMNAEQMEDARQVLSGERLVDIHQLGPAPKVGFPGIAALARRYGFTVYVDGPNAYGGMRAMIYIPEALLIPRNAKPEAELTVPQEEPEETVEDITMGGLPKRRRRSTATLHSAVEPEPEVEQLPGFAPGRSDIASAWQSGSRSGRSAAAQHTEGVTS